MHFRAAGRHDDNAPAVADAAAASCNVKNTPFTLMSKIES
jgi:hypothetical protein